MSPFCRVLDFSTTSKLFESYNIIIGLMYPEGDKSKDIPLDRCKLYHNELESPLRKRDLFA